MKKIFLTLLIFSIAFGNISANNKKVVKNITKIGISAQEIYKKGGLSKKDLSKIEIKLPHSSTFDLAGTGETSLAIWLEKLPKVDRNKNRYLILPSEGLIIPINSVPKNSKEYKNFVSGKEENFYSFLDTGTVELPGVSANGYGSHGNKVIFGHSSYFKSNKGRYKTHFQKIIGLEKTEEVWVFEKNSKTGFFDKYVYKVTNSYNTDDEDVSILESKKNKSEITLFTCTPIGGLTGRWVVKAEFVSKN